MRLIDANKLMNQWCDEMCKPKPNCEEDCAVYDYVRLAPSIDIVRCAECKYEPICSHSVQHTTHKSTSVTIGYKSVEWCSYGEREGE